MRRTFLSLDFTHCPYCGTMLPPEERGHRECRVCSRCLTCDEMASRGWKRNHPAGASGVSDA